MDIADFVEKEYDIKLLDWQKEYLRTIDREYETQRVRVLCLPRQVGYIFTYFKLKELLQNGTTNNRE